MESIFNSNTITFTPTALAITIGPIAGVIVLLIIFLLWQRRKINTLEAAAKPKYGFLGKPLYSFMALFMLAAAVGVGYLSSQGNSNIPDVSANKNLSVDIKYKIEKTVPGGYLVSFAAVPSVNSKPWGEAGSESFDLFWKVSGVQNFSEVELSKNIASPSRFTKILPSGTYTIVLDVFGKEAKVQKTITINL